MNGEQGWVLAADPTSLDMSYWPEAHTSEYSQPAADDTDESVDFGDDEFVEEQPAEEFEPEVKRPALKRKYVLVVSYGNDGDLRQVAYTKDEAKDLLLAYAITVHKSQGSEWPAVVFVAPKSHQFMLRRSLVYTAVTRASDYVLMIGQEAALAGAVKNMRGSERRTRLQSDLKSSDTSRGNSTLDRSPAHV
jgi:hypothetical protein